MNECAFKWINEKSICPSVPQHGAEMTVHDIKTFLLNITGIQAKHDTVV